MLAHELAEARADGGPEDLPCAALVDGELHLAHLAHADAGAVVLNGKAAEELCQPRDLHILAIDHALLAQGDDLFADAQKVALFIEGLDVAVDKLDIILADLDKVRLNGVAKINARGSLDFDILGAVCNKIHKKASFVQNLGSVNRTDGIVPQNLQNATINCKNPKKK